MIQNSDANWTYQWTATGPLHARFPRLFSCCEQPYVTVFGARMIGGVPGQWRLRFRRQLGLAEMVEWDNICRELPLLPAPDQPDSVSWSLEPSGVFSTRSVYLGLSQGAAVTCFKD